MEQSPRFPQADFVCIRLNEKATDDVSMAFSFEQVSGFVAELDPATFAV